MTTRAAKKKPVRRTATAALPYGIKPRALPATYAKAGDKPAVSLETRAEFAIVESAYAGRR